MAAWCLRRSCFAVVCLTCCCASYAAPIPEDSIYLVPNVSYISETLTLWQAPEVPVKKILLVLGDANINPYIFWDTSPSCPQCAGSPEMRNITIDALAKQYLVVVPKWNEGGFGGDGYGWMDPLPTLRWILEWRQVYAFYNVPMVALGISLGGEVMGILPNLHPGLFESIAFMVFAPSKNTFKDITSDYPPSIFIHMPKDKKREKRILGAMGILNGKGIRTSESAWYEQRITPDYFSKFIVGLNLTLSTAVWTNMKRDGLLDEEGFLITDFGSPHARDTWKSIIQAWHVLPVDPNIELGFQRVVERVTTEILIAYAFHNGIARLNEEMFRWFDGGYNDQKPCTTIAVS